MVMAMEGVTATQRRWQLMAQWQRNGNGGNIDGSRDGDSNGNSGSGWRDGNGNGMCDGKAIVLAAIVGAVAMAMDGVMAM